jgi:hypothetical protein
VSGDIRRNGGGSPAVAGPYSDTPSSWQSWCLFSSRKPLAVPRYTVCAAHSDRKGHGRALPRMQTGRPTPNSRTLEAGTHPMADTEQARMAPSAGCNDGNRGWLTFGTEFEPVVPGLV